MAPASRLIPSLVAGGTALGVLLAQLTPTEMKAAPEPPWRTAAREAQIHRSPYSYVQTASYPYGPSFAWSGLDEAGPGVPFPEDYERRLAAIRLPELLDEPKADAGAGPPAEARDSQALQDASAEGFERQLYTRVIKAAARAEVITEALHPSAEPIVQRAPALRAGPPPLRDDRFDEQSFPEEGTRPSLEPVPPGVYAPAFDVGEPEFGG